MHFKKTLITLVFISFLFNCKNEETVRSEVLIIPQPSEQITNTGQFILSASTGINYDETFKISAEFLKSYIEVGSNIKLKANNTILFIKDDTLSDEGYSLEIHSKTIEIKAKTDQGAFYAVQSLRQLLPVEIENGSYTKDEIVIPSVTIKDEPEFIYRGMHLDVGRHMFSVDFIKKYFLHTAGHQAFLVL